MHPGSVIVDRFELHEVAASGGMGAVHRAVDRMTGERVAVKLLRTDEGSSADRFVREARVLAQMTHPGIVRYLAHGRTPAGELFLAMEWLEGETLAKRLGRGLAISDTVLVARRIAEVLAATHARAVVHRDIKPSNVFLVGGDPTRVKVLDFGIARMNDASRAMTATGMLVGTPGFMAPEQVRGDKNIGPAADLFSLGCVLFACLIGRAPFRGDDVIAVLAKVVLEDVPRVRELRADVPGALDELVARLLAKEPSDRPKSADEVVRILSELRDLPSQPQLPDVPSSPALTMGEQRLVSLILVGDARSAPEEATVVTAPAHGDPIDGIAAAHGGRLIALADGRALVTLPANGAPMDQARQAAACALALHAAAPRRPMALATGRGELAARLPVGEVVDRAARLLRAATEAMARGAVHGVRIDELAAGLLPVDFEVGGDGISLVLQRRSELEQTRTLLGKPTPCVGRDRELAMLRATYDEVVNESVARVALVTAPPGVGKSRLRYELLRELAKRDDAPEVWSARGDPIGAGSPFGMLASALRRVLGLRDGEPVEVGRRKIRARVARHVAPREASRVSEFLGELVGVHFVDDDSVQLRAARQNAVLMGDQMLRAWEDFVAAECARGPLVLVLDDLHWGDGPTVRFVDSALRLLEDHPFMVLALGRPEVNDVFPRLWSERAVQPIPLGALTKRAAEKLVSAALGERATPATVAEIVERAAGNAFYLEELIRAVAEGEGARLPETVLAMVQARLDALEPEARRVLRAASVFGQVFWARGVVSLLGGGQDEVQVRDWLSELTTREIIAPRASSELASEDEFVFRHALVRDAAYAMLTPADETLGHALAGRWLESAGQRDAMVLAEHYARGGQPTSAIEWYRRAAEQALEGNDFEAVRERAERGIACSARDQELGRLRLLQAEAARWRGDFASVNAYGLRALEALERGSAPWLTASAEVAVASARLGLREQLLDVAQRLAGSPEIPGTRPARVMAFARAAMQLVVGGSHDRAEALLEDLREHEESLERDEPFALGRLLEARAMLAIGRGNTAIYLKYVTAAAEAFERVGDLRMLCNQRTNIGYATRELGAFEEAEQALRGALAAAERMGLLSLATIAKHNLGPVLARAGRFDAAIAVEREAIDACVRQGDRWTEGGSRIYLAGIYARAGRLGDAESEARKALEVASDLPPLCCYARGALARLLLQAGKNDEALAHAAEAARDLEALGGIEEGEAIVRLAHAEALRATGHDDEARAAIERARFRLVERAARIEDTGLRRSFLENIDENARTMQLGGTSP